MALFGSNQDSPDMAQEKRTLPDQINLVGEGTVFEGTLRAGSDVRTSGRIVGRLEVKGKAIVAEDGAVEGEIVATNADVAGRVEGEIYVEEQLVLKSSARVDGDIETGRLVVEEGAFFTGECRMGDSTSSKVFEGGERPARSASASGSSSSKKGGGEAKKDSKKDSAAKSDAKASGK